MSRLAELIEELCPDGVEFRRLDELFATRNGYTPSRGDMSAWDSHDIPWFRMEDIRENGGILDRAMTYVSSSAVKNGVLFPENSMLVATSATIGAHALITVPHLSNQRFTSLQLKDEYRKDFDYRFLYYYCFILDAFCLDHVNVSSFPSVDMKAFRSFEFPLVPLAVQREIVRILDQFTTLEAELEVELEAELEARRAQYEHYRNHLLSYESLAARGPVEMVKLGAVSRISAGYGFPKSEQGCSSGEYPFYKVSDMNHPGNQVFLEGASNYLSGPDIRRLKMTPFPAGAIVFPKIGAAIATNKKRILSCLSLVDNNVAVCIPEGVDGKYLYYWLLEQDLRFVAHDSGAVPSIRKTDLEQLDVPVPSVAEQERIVEVLDRFNALVNEISAGLPAEIAARRAQYEHYRDRLLSFPEKKAE